MTPTKKEESKQPLDMTSEEAINFLFPKEVVKKLKAEANPEPKKKEPDCENDSAYEEA